MAFGVYIHIPYCIQRCTYCDFATYEQSKILPPDQYVELLFKEIRQKHRYYTPQSLDTIYFGGGTPSLIPANLIVAIIKELGRYGFTTRPDTEITIEINPATVSKEKLKTYLDNGINRFSVGAQTFDDRLLKMVHREHSAKQTLETLDLLRAHGVNFSFDILFALPSQTVEGLRRDVEIAVEQGAKHISPYCLTVPDGHPLSKGRPIDDEQVEMFDIIADELTRKGFQQYEISNFALPGFESRHNMLYWVDQPYWSLGLSSHSYSKESSWGTRYWNINSINEYQKQILAFDGQEFDSPVRHLPSNQVEVLEMHQALTDFCHTSMRLMRGLNVEQLQAKFPQNVSEKVLQIMKNMEEKSWIRHDNGHWSLTREGLVLSNRVFQELTFLQEDL
ncbi:radical SAM family heme chaperone HemW [Bdellovibrio bacteriovorus]|uniref:Heme chaperone HemW n=1 Tax=Bdellovibrio bacteriovorus str. Tiberius TaxID=1069642 RepID=K7ZCQ7_BDEBC|nr:radical SAM family heme chaperone HemW [Bdellovibrio bacteriovorus]AFY03409.1 oxygen-independent coproporphyrinogen III oxidase, putative [Bdellovibrio bacteriovorus str. Tiberius]